MSQDQKAIVVNGLRKSYEPVIAVDGVSFQVEAGEIFGMVGPNGSGKTTTIECIEGLRQPDEGEISVLGLDPNKDVYELRERTGIQLQAANLPRRMRVEEALDLFTSFYRQTRDWRPLMAGLGLEDKRRAYFSQLSGGQKQRLFVALALVNQPEVVFLDELTTGLDPRARHNIWDLVREIREQGTTIFLTTHYMDEAERLCDRVAILDHGRMIALDTPAQLVNKLGMATRITFQVNGGRTVKRNNGGERDSTAAFDAAQVGVLDGVQRVEKEGDQVTVYGQGAQLIGAVINTLETGGVQIHNLRTEQADLEDVFLALTGREVENSQLSKMGNLDWRK
ncbi:MAG TPA: ABC transporter ATP-binding protein [Anaerolineales bacterium]|nr:ABC transporter ATP-binding protein [Anaerolineales bacterium]